MAPCRRVKTTTPDDMNMKIQRLFNPFTYAEPIPRAEIIDIFCLWQLLLHVLAIPACIASIFDPIHVIPENNTVVSVSHSNPHYQDSLHDASGRFNHQPVQNCNSCQCAHQRTCEQRSESSYHDYICTKHGDTHPHGVQGVRVGGPIRYIPPAVRPTVFPCSHPWPAFCTCG